jgi:hypothetical protein
MNNSNKFILFYSNQCRHCEQFNKMLYKSNHFNEFVRICIDDKSIRSQIPSTIKTVPTILLPTKPRRQLQGKEVFEWFNTINKVNKAADIGVEAFSGDMGGYSDNFSFVDNDKKPLEHTFAFLNKNNEQIVTPPQDSGENLSSSNVANSNGGSSSGDSSYERLLEQRSRDMPQTNRL